jgi:predicted  nucleic acid-binding Zn-ribbon protein
MSRAAALMRLQQIDTEMDARQARLAEIEQDLAADQGLAAAQAALAAAARSLAATRNSVRALEAEAQALSTKAAEVERTLYAGRVTNPKELVDMQEELASLKRRRASLEDEILDGMVEAEAEEQVEREAQAAVGKVEGALGASRQKLADERGAIEAALTRLETQHEAAEAPVPAEDRRLYQSLRQRKHGVAVARLEEGACGACGVAPSSSRAQAARHSVELVFCGNCERILYGE